MGYGKLMCPVYRRAGDVYRYSHCVELSLEGGRGIGAGDASLQRSKDGIFHDFKKMPAIFMVGAETTRMVSIYDEETEVVVSGYDPDRYYQRACAGVVKRDQTVMVSNNTSIVWRRGGRRAVTPGAAHGCPLRIRVWFRGTTTHVDVRPGVSVRTCIHVHVYMRVGMYVRRCVCVCAQVCICVGA